MDSWLSLSHTVSAVVGGLAELGPEQSDKLNAVCAHSGEWVSLAEAGNSDARYLDEP